MEIVIFIFYFLLFVFIITLIPFIKNSGITKPVLITLFSIKVFAGVAYAKFYTLPKYYQGSDTWRFYRLSLQETRWLLSDPGAFLKDLFIYGYTRPGNIFSGENTYWNDLKSNLPVKILAVTNVVTHNSYYADIIFFNFLFFFGLIALYRFFIHLFPGKKLLIIAGLFLLPSALFWCSGIHKDGLIVSATGMLIYSLFKTFKYGLSFKKTVVIALSLLLIFALRNYIVFALIPGMAAWWLSNRYPSKKVQIFFGIYLLCLTLFFILPILFHSLNFPAYITQKRDEFYLLQAGSEIEAPPLRPSFPGFISFFPYAFDMAFLRPHPTEIRNVSYIPAAAETLLLLLLVIVSVISIGKKQKISPEVLFLLSFALSIMLVCGYTIPFTGAVVRYRSLALPLIITPLLCLSDFARLRKRSSFNQ